MCAFSSWEPPFRKPLRWGIFKSRLRQCYSNMNLTFVSVLNNRIPEIFLQRAWKMVLKTFFINFSKIGSMWPFGVRLNLQPVIFRFHIHNVFGFHLNMNMNMKKSVTDRCRSVTLFFATQRGKQRSFLAEGTQPHAGTIFYNLILTPYLSIIPETH